MFWRHANVALSSAGCLCQLGFQKPYQATLYLYLTQRIGALVCQTVVLKSVKAAIAAKIVWLRSGEQETVSTSWSLCASWFSRCFPNFPGLSADFQQLPSRAPPSPPPYLRQRWCCWLGVAALIISAQRCQENFGSCFEACALLLICGSWARFLWKADASAAEGSPSPLTTACCLHSAAAPTTLMTDLSSS